jgi:hypothetical protein
MSEETVLRGLFDRWERVWHEGRYELIPECVGPTYTRHDEAGDRTVTRDAYAAELARLLQPNSPDCGASARMCASSRTTMGCKATGPGIASP